MKKPIIGVVPLYDDEKESLWMLPGYMDGIVDAGAIFAPALDIKVQILHY